MSGLETEVIKPEKCPECGSIFIDYHNKELKCLVKSCGYVFKPKISSKNNQKIIIYQ